MSEDKGKYTQIQERLKEAGSEDELRQIQNDLVDEGFEKKTVQNATSEMRKNGQLRFSRTLSITSQGKANPIQAFIDNVHAPKQSSSGYIEGFEDGIRHERENLVISLMALQQLSALGVQQSKPVIEMAKEMRQSENQAAQMLAEQLRGAIVQGDSQILSAVRQQSQAQSPDAGDRMINFITTLPQLLQSGQQLMQALGIKMPGQRLAQTPPSQMPQPQPPLTPPPPIQKHSIEELEAE